MVKCFVEVGPYSLTDLLKVILFLNKRSLLPFGPTKTRIIHYFYGSLWMLFIDLGYKLCFIVKYKHGKNSFAG